MSEVTTFWTVRDVFCFGKATQDFLKTRILTKMQSISIRSELMNAKRKILTVAAFVSLLSASLNSSEVTLRGY
jgi:hypothetical protein